MEGIEIKITQLKKSLLQYQVAGIAGLPPIKLSEIVTGRQEPSSEQLELLSWVLSRESGQVLIQRSEND